MSLVLFLQIVALIFIAVVILTASSIYLLHYMFKEAKKLQAEMLADFDEGGSLDEHFADNPDVQFRTPFN
jgi:hypothetical protein